MKKLPKGKFSPKKERNPRKERKGPKRKKALKEIGKGWTQKGKRFDARNWKPFFKKNYPRLRIRIRRS